MYMLLLILYIYRIYIFIEWSFLNYIFLILFIYLYNDLYMYFNRYSVTVKNEHNIQINLRIFNCQLRSIYGFL